MTFPEDLRWLVAERKEEKQQQQLRWQCPALWVFLVLCLMPIPFVEMGVKLFAL